MDAIDYISYSDTPLQEVIHPVAEKHGVRLLVKREDLNHPLVSGNKWWKLKYNLLEARSKGRVLTFGGAYSNHIYATAAACSELGIACIGVIRGERIEPLNPTLSFAESRGMKLHFVTREKYRAKDDQEFIDSLQRIYGDCYLIPEGGTNHLAIQGCKELGEKLMSLEFNEIFLAVGTGGTIAGLAASILKNRKISGVSVLKGGEFLRKEVLALLGSEGGPSSNFNLFTEYHFGGYGKVTNELLSFISEMQTAYALPLDPVYTGKLLWAIFAEIEKGNFPRGTTILALHTGGLQGATTIMNNFAPTSL